VCGWWCEWGGRGRAGVRRAGGRAGVWVDVRVGSGRRAEEVVPAGVGSVREVVLTCRRAWGRQCKQREGVREMARACVRRACGRGTRGRACVATL